MPGQQVEVVTQAPSDRTEAAGLGGTPRWTALAPVAWRIWGVLAVLSIPVLLITASLRGLVAAPSLYDYGFEKYGISEAVGISPEDLKGVVAPAFIRYFTSDDERLQIRVRVAGVERDLFTEREVVHMRDVKGLIVFNSRLMWASLGVLATYAFVAALRWRFKAGPRLARTAFGGALVTIALLLALGLGALVGFDQLFLQFHLISFANDFWQLDPRQHYLIAMFPEAFFRDATLAIAATVLAEAAVLAGVAGFLLRHARKRRALAGG